MARKLVRQVSLNNKHIQQYDDGTKVYLQEVPPGIETNPQRKAIFEDIYESLIKKVERNEELDEDQKWMLKFFTEKLGK